MKPLQYTLALTFCLFTLLTNAQIFTDNLTNEVVGDSPTKWKNIQGAATIGTIEGEKVISLANESIIIPIINSNNYLEDEFSLEFDAYFDQVEKAISYQYYRIRFWDGIDNEVIETDSGQIVTFPLNIYRNGASIEQTIYNPQVSKERFNKFVQNLESKEGLWRSIAINYNKQVCKISIDGTEIISINNPKFSPKMISIGGYYLQFSQDYKRAIKNINISGIKTETNDSDTSDINTETDTNTDIDTETDTNSGFDIKTDTITSETENYAYNLPEQDGTSNQILQTDGNGTVNWVDFPLIETEPHTHETVSDENTNSETQTDSITTIAASTGLEAIDEGNGIGWRLKGRDPIYYNNIGFNAVDLSFTESTSGFDLGASGKSSFAMGNLVAAEGEYSFAMGVMSIATGDYSMAFGETARSLGKGSIAIGVKSMALKDYSTAIGHNVRADEYGSITLGLTSKASNLYAIAIGTEVSTEGLGAVAIGQESTASGQHSAAIGFNAKASGTLSIALGSHSNASGNSSTAFGPISIASGKQSIALGYESEASGNYSLVMGRSTIASGVSSTAIGDRTTATGVASTAIGYQTTASAFSSLAMGYQTIASGYNSVSFGRHTKSESYLNTAIGIFNIGGGDPQYSKEKDPLFEIGNGTNDSNRSNALTVLKNGNTGIGTHQPWVRLHIDGGKDASLNTGGYMIIGDKQGENLVFDNNEIMARKNVQPATLYLQHNGGDVFIGGSVVHSSDQRLKQDIENLSYGLNEVMQLRPVSYHWKSNPEATQKSMGLIAQEVQPIIEELITINTEHNNTLGVNYTELIPILIKALQEQQTIIETQDKKLKDLSSNLTEKDEVISQIIARVKQIESLLKTDKL